MTLQAIRNAWNDFFFTKQPVTGIAVFRICFGLVLILNALFLLAGFSDWFGSHAIVQYSTALTFTGTGRINLFSILGASDSSAYLIYGTHLIAIVGLTLGLWTRSSAVVAFITLVSLHHRDPLILNSGDTAMRVVLFLLMFSRAGDAFSLDRWRALKAGTTTGPPAFQMPWAQRLMQIQICIIYFSTACFKLQGEAWTNGTAVYYTTRLWDFERFPVPFLNDSLVAIRLMTWASLAIECALCSCVWVKEWRNTVLILGVLLHLSIEYSMNIPVFQWVMMSLLVAMVAPQDMDRWVAGLQGRWNALPAPLEQPVPVSRRRKAA